MSLIKIEIQYDTSIGDLFVPKDATHINGEELNGNMRND